MEGKRKVSLSLVTPPQAAVVLNEISIVLNFRPTVLNFGQNLRPIVLNQSFLKGGGVSMSRIRQVARLVNYCRLKQNTRPLPSLPIFGFE